MSLQILLLPTMIVQNFSGVTLAQSFQASSNELYGFINTNLGVNLSENPSNKWPKGDDPNAPMNLQVYVKLP